MALVNIPWQEPVPEAKACPKCGKVDPHMRTVSEYVEPYAVCCGGEGCGFYQSAPTRAEAVERWNASDANTSPKPAVNKYTGKVAEHQM